MAGTPPAQSRFLRFGPFELDVRAGELRKHGIRIKLREQPVQILLMLLDHPGEVVLRDEIRLRLWPNNTIVEFDHGINAAIQKLRDGLGESADNPGYIETVARRGYRFLGEVERVGEPHPEPQPVAAPVDTEDLAGKILSHYRILSKLGEGGMGVVYRAEDLKLGRHVALKFLPKEAGELPERMLRRFEQEARAASALNHPHICTVHGLEELGGQPAIVMELVEGDTLAGRLAKGALPLDQSVALATQIAGALAEAHRRGVVHRDLKPSNIMLTKSGAKVLDFGLARMERAVAASPEGETLTQKGAIVGTLHYMSPEQVQGKEADARSDIFSFGLVLYEMLTGRRAFEGESAASVMAGIMEREPPPLKPDGLNRVVKACLAKDPDDRFQTAGDLKRAIEWSVAGGSETPLLEGAPVPGGTRHPWLAWGVAAALAVGLATVAFLHFRERLPAPAAPVRFQVAVPERSRGLTLSPDGRKLAFLAGDRLWVQSLESGESRDLTACALATPFWSPDSRFIGFVYQGKLKKIEETGGSAQTVTDLRDNLWGGGAWNQDDVIVFGDRRLGLFRVPASSGVPVQITALDSARHENSQFCPSFLPDGRHFVYVRASTDEGKSAICLGSVDAKPEQQSSKPLAASNSQPVYAPSGDPNTGYLLFVREGTLMAQPFDNRRLELKGQAALVAERVSVNIAGAIFVAFSASANGVLAFPRSSTSYRHLIWYDREGKVMGTAGEPGLYGGLALSPEGTRLAVEKNSGGADTVNIWLLDLSRGGASTRFTFGSFMDARPVWSPDGSRIIFSSNRDGPYNLYQKQVNGVKDEEVLLKSSEDKVVTSWSRDRRFLLYTVVHPKTKNDLWVLPLEGGRKPVPFLITEFNERWARFSPDGHWVAYTSNESGQDEVYVRSFSMNSAGTAVEAGGKWKISSEFGQDPHWRGDGRELYYRSRGGGLLAVEIATNPAFRAGNPQPLGVSTFALEWDSAADGRRFLSLATKSGLESYTVVLNWQAGLKK